jgi:hypothetical protein
MIDMALELRHQRVMRGAPQTIRYDHGQQTAPPIAILKTHQEMASADYISSFTYNRMPLVSISL